jgi:hypothetical protein
VSTPKAKEGSRQFYKRDSGKGPIAICTTVYASFKFTFSFRLELTRSMVITVKITLVS